LLHLSLESLVDVVIADEDLRNGFAPYRFNGGIRNEGDGDLSPQDP
jgi:hypothetical protein